MESNFFWRTFRHLAFHTFHYVFHFDVIQSNYQIRASHSVFGINRLLSVPLTPTLSVQRLKLTLGIRVHVIPFGNRAFRYFYWNQGKIELNNNSKVAVILLSISDDIISSSRLSHNIKCRQDTCSMLSTASCLPLVSHHLCNSPAKTPGPQPQVTFI